MKVKEFFHEYFIFSQTILAPQSPFYTNIAKDCVANGVSVDLFLFPNSYIDVATIGLLATQTGGQVYRYSYFKVGQCSLCIVYCLYEMLHTMSIHEFVVAK